MNSHNCSTQVFAQSKASYRTHKFVHRTFKALKEADKTNSLKEDCGIRINFLVKKAKVIEQEVGQSII
jgi:hypothetical protein